MEKCLNFLFSRYVQCAENSDWVSGDCSELAVCVTIATTQSDVLSEIFPPSHLILSDNTSENVESFGKGRCNVLAGGSVEVSSASIEEWFEGEYITSSIALSRESLALVTTEDDPLWSKFVHWVVVATLHAEEQNITQATFFEMPRVDLLRPMITDEMLRNVIRAVGSYGEIWERNAASRGLQRDGRNQLNTYPLSPLLISDQTWNKPTSS